MLTGGACAPAGQITTSSLEHDIRNDERMVDLERSTVDTWTETIDLTQEATPVEPSARTALPRTAMQRHRNHLLAATQELSQDPVDKKSSRVKGHSTQRVRRQKKRPCVAEDRHAIWSGVY
ncbi:uncharacterized protein RHO25_006991 [Cercospora beticola]|uniref:Uncharacterized protein n=1 Tax=Cercospora beticola TaxID=122368 RepID=A0ABZ0NSB0_CERBT|nr:hypothetical protein RHO25_006991 [Cercospora beticola]